MKLSLAIVLMLLIALIFPTHATAQARILVGGSGGESFNNLFIGPVIAVEIPFAKKFEFDSSFEIAPEFKRGYGYGYEDNVTIGGIRWISSKFGFRVSGEQSRYAVTTATKDASFFHIGPIWRGTVAQAPMRLSLEYTRQFHNGISNGTETSHFNGGQATLDIRTGCAGSVCGRFKLAFQVGHFLNQGNPVCDGTFGNGSQVGFLPCPRSGGVSGGVIMSVSMEFPRRKGHEDDIF